MTDTEILDKILSDMTWLIERHTDTDRPSSYRVGVVDTALDVKRFITDRRQA